MSAGAFLFFVALAIPYLCRPDSSIDRAIDRISEIEGNKTFLSATPTLASPSTTAKHYNPAGLLVAARIMLFTALPLFVVGSCIYARGIGYPFWLGIFGVTLIGLLILMLLPDRFPEPEDNAL